MTKISAIGFAKKKIPDILPMEDGDVELLCEQVLGSGSLEAGAVAQAFLEFLGESELAFEFVFEFCRLLEEADESKSAVKSSTANVQNGSSKISKSVESIPAKPETPSTIKRVPRPESINVQTTRMKQSSKTKHKDNEGRERQGDNKRKIHSLQAIEEVVKMLELESDNEKNGENYSCDCQALRHPLFEAAPNCLSCGKIICAKEGMHLNNCSFCGADLIPLEERLKMIEILKDKREKLIDDSIKKREQNLAMAISGKKAKEKAIKVSTGRGKNLFTDQDALFDMIEKKHQDEQQQQQLEAASQPHDEGSDDELDFDLIDAKERLEKLLHFQETSAERTKIIDNASDFSMADNVGIWGSAKEKALMLKKQQRNRKKWEKAERERNGRRSKYTMNIDIGPSNIVTLSDADQLDEINRPAYSDDDLDGISDEEDLKNLKDIKELKEALETEKKENSGVLHSSIWDPEKYATKFAAPIYVSKVQETAGDVGASQSVPQWKHRVQIDESDTNEALEQNILAVL